MVEQLLERSGASSAQLDAVFRSLADPTRRSMLRMLSEGERSVGELAQPFEMSFAGASKHVKVLEDAGLVRRTIRGRIHSCRLVTEPLAAADEWFDYYSRFWTSRLDALQAALRDEKAQAQEQAAGAGSTSTSPKVHAPNQQLHNHEREGHRNDHD